jgi:peptide/nickel transport system permease protein
MTQAEESALAGQPSRRGWAPRRKQADLFPASSLLSPAALARRRFWHNRLAVVGSGILLVFIVAAIFAPVITRYSPTEIDVLHASAAPSSAHWLGTDDVGRDVFSRLVYGARISLTVGIVTSVAVYLIGIIVGVTAGWFGSWIDQLLMRISDIFLAIPPVLVILVVAGIFGPNLPLLIALIAGVSWPNVARIARSSVLSLREQEFVLAAVTVGAGSGRIITRYLVPAVQAPVIVASTLLGANAILLEAALSFLGVGVQPPTPSWGNMLTDAQSITVISSEPWLWIPAGLAIVVTVLAVTFVGDGIGDATNSRMATL